MNILNITDAINEHVRSFAEEIKSYPHYSEITKKMECAQKEIGYEFEEISFLTLAFCRTKSPFKRTYKNDTLAQVGDAILDTIIVEKGFVDRKSKEDIDKSRKRLANNEELYSITKDKDLTRFCYHDRCFHDEAKNDCQVSVGKHDAIVEAIIGAIYFDGGIDKARSWIYKNIIKDIGD